MSIQREENNNEGTENILSKIKEKIPNIKRCTFRIDRKKKKQTDKMRKESSTTYYR